MANKCPTCHSDNPDTQRFCGGCGTQLPPPQEHPPVVTETLQTPVHELTTGSTFAGRYQVIEELGHGGMGRVYKVHDTKIGEKIALKLIRPEAGLDRTAVERFSNELKLARKIRHKNVCQMFDLGEDQGTRYITMEYVHGEDLKQLIRKVGRLSPGQAIAIARQVCEGLEEAHRLGIVHRDLKPQNIMVDENGNSRIMDFGIARSLTTKSITGAGVMIGTPEYMCPEQVEGREVDLRGDIYSLGIILYEMLTGRVPFEGETPFTIGVKHKSEPPRDPRELNVQIPEDLARVILRCLAKNRDERYRTAQELDLELEKIEKGIPTTERILPSKKPLTSREITVKLNVKKMLVPAVAFIGVLIVGIVGWRLWPKKAATPKVPVTISIAILPFEDLSPGKDQEYFCSGLTDELINRLTQVPSLRIPARTSVFAVKARGLDIREIGNALQVANILEGSVRRSEDRIRVTVQLVKASDGYPLWSERYERSERDLFSLQDDLSLEIIDKLKVELLGAVREKVTRRYTEDQKAYDLYLRGAWLFENKLSEGDWLKAVDHFERAVATDPGFSLAYAWLADAYLNLSMWHFIAAEEALPKARKALERALEIDKELPQALVVSGKIKFRFDFDWPGGEADIERAIALDPNNASARSARSMIMMIKGRVDEGLRERLELVELDPLSTSTRTAAALLLYHARRFDDAIGQTEMALGLDPNYSYAHYVAGMCRIQKASYPQAIADLERSVALSGNSTEQLSSLAYAWAVSGNPERASRALGELTKGAYVSKMYLAAVEAALGNKDRAFALLDEAYRERDPDLVWVKTDPKFDVLRSDPRFATTLARIGLRE